jgi:hypothetical protein
MTCFISFKIFSFIQFSIKVIILNVDFDFDIGLALIAVEISFGGCDEPFH